MIRLKQLLSSVKNLNQITRNSHINEQVTSYETNYDQWAYNKDDTAGRDFASTYIKVPKGSTFKRVGNKIQTQGYMGEDWNTPNKIAPADTLKTDMLYTGKRSKLTSRLKLFNTPKTLTWSTGSFASLVDKDGREYYIVDGNLVIALINTFVDKKNRADTIQTVKSVYGL